MSSTREPFARRALRKARNMKLVDQRVFAADLEEESLSRLRQAKLFAVWEEWHLNRLLRYLDVDCVFDVGANQGQYATMLREGAGYQGLIVSFEPSPAEAATAREAAAGDPLWHVEEIALADRDGTMDLHLMERHTFNSLSRPRHDETQLFETQNRVVDTVTVRTETLDTAFERLQAEHGFERPFLKLDTQGFDVAIARSGPRNLERFLGLQSELAIALIYEDAVGFREAITAYEELGFEMSAIVPNNAGHFPRLVESDCIMVRSSAIHD